VKILLAHNFYGSTAPSGENIAFMAEADLLRNRGHSIIEFIRHSDELLQRGFTGKLKGALGTVWNPVSLRGLKIALNETKPDIVHVHNTFPLLSPSVFYATRDLNIPTVMTMHNYRIGCSAATAIRKDEPCTLCLDKKSVLPALRYGCYRDSRMATLPVSLMIALHSAKDTWKKNVDAFITLTDFQKEKMAQFGISQESLFVKPHFFENPPEFVPGQEREVKAVFIGRLYAAKGIHILVDSWKKWGKNAARLEIIGDGPMKSALMRTVETSEASGAISFLGNLPHADAMKRLSSAKLLILPSLCFEGFPMVIQEAYAFGVPVAASNIGALPHLIAENRTGTLFAPGNAESLLAAVQPLFADDRKLRAWSGKARQEFEAKYTAGKNYEILMSIYEAAAANRKAKFN
jgi:glycosyltransferase involved in cell wall biosynthesis